MSIYFDHNATTPIRPRVLDAIIAGFKNSPANPNSAHQLGQKARRDLEDARALIASALKVNANQLVFTGSATEANASAILNHFEMAQKKSFTRKKILASPFEHSCVHENLLWLQKNRGAEIIWMPTLKAEASIDLAATLKLIKDQADSLALVTLIAAHNETGVLQPWQSVAKAAAEVGVPFHMDAVQWLGREALELGEFYHFSMGLGFHKIGGPKGIGLLYISRDLPFEPLLRGGPQEKKRRAGTENIPLILGVGALMQELPEILKFYSETVEPLRNYFEEQMLLQSPTLQIAGQISPRLKNTSYLIFGKGLRSDALIAGFDIEGFCVSAGSACSSGMTLASRALLALGYSDAIAASAIRFSLGMDTTMQDIQKILAAARQIQLRMAA